MGFLPGTIIYTAFEVQYLIDYPDMPIFFIDWKDRYLESIEKMHEANMALLEAMSDIGVELYGTGSAGVELLSPGIFRDGIVPYQREFNDLAHRLGRYVNYHICGYSRQLIEMKLIDAIRPTIFETCSAPPCGNNDDLSTAVRNIDEGIITKGNFELELLRNGTVEEIFEAVKKIKEATSGRRHIVGQGDATILAGTPDENIRAFLDAAMG